MCNHTYLIGEPLLFEMMFSTAGLGASLAGSCILYQELSGKLTFADFIFKLKYKLIKYPLNYSNKIKFEQRFSLAQKYILNLFLVIGIITSSMLYIFSAIFALILGYFNETSIINLVAMLFFVIAQSIAIYHSVALFLAALFSWYSTTLFLTLKFNEIANKMKLSVKCMQNRRSYQLLKNSITEHSYLENMTHRLNTTFRMLFFICYFLASPAALCCLYGTHHRSTNIYMRFIMALIVITAMFLFLKMVRMSASINEAAKRPKFCLYSYLVRPNLKMREKERLRLMSFVEHLSDREIGFYCYDLFPLNNYQFYQYLYVIGINYFLIMGLF